MPPLFNLASMDELRPNPFQPPRNATGQQPTSFVDATFFEVFLENYIVLVLRDRGKVGAAPMPALVERSCSDRCAACGLAEAAHMTSSFIRQE
jgi:hypothetical protein